MQSLILKIFNSLMRQLYSYRYGILLFLFLIISSCNILKKKKNCDCPEFSNLIEKQLKNQILIDVIT